jgi:hypothetical protein
LAMPVNPSQTQTDMDDADAINLLSGEKARELTKNELCRRVYTASPVATSQSIILALGNASADASSLQLGAKATALM